MTPKQRSESLFDKKPGYVEGWVEFKDKKKAYKFVNLCNGEFIGKNLFIWNN